MPLPLRCYANVAVMPTRADAPAPKPIGPQRTAAAAAEREQESQLKRTIDRADALLDRLEAREAAIAGEIKRLQQRKAAAAARFAQIEARILSEMSAAQLDRVAGLRASWKAKPNAQSLVVDDEAAIPAEYLRESVSSAANKIAIKAALAADPDLVIAGVHLAQSVSLKRT